MFIDPHVHLRDFNQKEKETVKHGLEVARDVGLDAVFDMPNTDPALLTRETIEDRLRLARDADVPEVFYGVYGGLTTDAEQVKRIVELAQKEGQVVGLKLYAGHSVGNLGIVKPEQQQQLYDQLEILGYEGVLVVHAEKEALMMPEQWNPLQPLSHCFARPAKAEVESVKDQIYFAKSANFKGKLHIAHISSPRAVDEVVEAKKHGLKISSGVCPHHLFYSWGQMNQPQGLLWKMNPPLRDPGSQHELLTYLRQGKIDLLETDHAPHTQKDKLEHPYCSGMTSLAWWPWFTRYLQAEKFTARQIRQLTFDNTRELFNLDIVRSSRPMRDRRADYPFNQWKALESRVAAFGGVL